MDSGTVLVRWHPLHLWWCLGDRPHRKCLVVRSLDMCPLDRRRIDPASCSDNDQLSTPLLERKKQNEMVRFTRLIHEHDRQGDGTPEEDKNQDLPRLHCERLDAPDVAVVRPEGQGSHAGCPRDR